MRHIHPFRAGVAVGIIVGFWHVLWVTLVGLGWAKPVLDFILRLHFVELQYQLAPYAALTAGMLVAITFSIGLLFGVSFALVWNWLAKAVPPSTGMYDQASATVKV
jgi:hypothetical protein